MDIFFQIEKLKPAQQDKVRQVFAEECSEVVAVLGFDKAVEFFNKFGGKRFRFPCWDTKWKSKKTPNTLVLEEALGESAAAKIIVMFSGHAVEISTCKKTRRAVANYLIVNDLDDLIAQGLSGFKASEAVALKHGCSMRWVYKLGKMLV